MSNIVSFRSHDQY